MTPPPPLPWRSRGSAWSDPRPVSYRFFWRGSFFRGVPRSDPPSSLRLHGGWVFHNFRFFFKMGERNKATCRDIFLDFWPRTADSL
jgi:hypothetical protein